MSRYDWMDNASCAQNDPGLWHNGHYTAAERICLACPVRPQCETHLAHLATEGDEHGMWAARSRQQRKTRDGRRRPAYNHGDIARLLDRGGMTVDEIADHIGCDVRTVYRVQKNYRNQQAEAVTTR